MFDGCGTPGAHEELACTDPFETTKEAEIAVVAGEELSIVVDSPAYFWAGPYELTATFTRR